MRRVLLLILGVCVLTSVSSPGFSEKPLRLFFEKNIPSELKPDHEEHVVREGEWLYKILTSKGYTATDIQSLIPRILELNPHIPDLNNLKPGQVLHLPDRLASTRPSPPPEPAVKTPPPTVPVDEAHEKLPYVIQPGDTLVEVLQRHGVPANVIFNRYLGLFQELNPEITNTDKLKVGQEVFLPVFATGPSPESNATATLDNATYAPHGYDPEAFPRLGFGNATQGVPGQVHTPTLPPKSASNADIIREMLENKSEQNSTSDTRQPRSGLPFVRSILEQMRFVFVPGDEGIYPLPESGWLHVKHHETPLIETPWGEKVILCATPKNSEWISNANALGMQVCSISPQWSLQEILDKLHEKFPENFRLWTRDKELVLSRNGLNFTLMAPQIAIVEHSKRKNIYLIWGRESSEEPPLPQGLPEVLEPSRVKIIELDAFNELSRLPARHKDSIIMNVASHQELIRAINPPDPEQLFGPTLPESLHSLLELLKTKNLLRQSMIRTAWVRGSQRLIAVQVPAWTVATGQGTIALLDRRFADEFLVSLFSHEGYSCFILPE